MKSKTPHPQWSPEGWYKLPVGWLWCPISLETWELINLYGDIEKTPDECLKELILKGVKP